MIDGTWLVLRAAGLVLTLQATGTVVFWQLFQPVCLSQALRRGAVHTAGAAAALVTLQLLMEPVHLALEWAAVTDPAMLRLAAQSSATHALGVRGLGLLCILTGLRAGTALRLLGVALVVISFAVSGHTVEREPRAILVACVLLHVMLVSFWFGALAPLRVAVLRRSAETAGQLIAQFSQLAVWLVPLIALAGLALAVFLLPNAAALVQPYGVLLLAKALLFAVLMGLAGWNRLRLVPALMRGDPGGAATLARTIGTEWLLICIVLAVTAFMTGNFSPD
jgi:copper resistance protein D